MCRCRARTGEVKVLVSGDGGNFEEAACWKQSIRQDVAYTETIFFNAPTNTKATITQVIMLTQPAGMSRKRCKPFDDIVVHSWLHAALQMA